MENVITYCPKCDDLSTQDNSGSYCKKCGEPHNRTEITEAMYAELPAIKKEGFVLQQKTLGQLMLLNKNVRILTYIAVGTVILSAISGIYLLTQMSEFFSLFI